MPRPGACAIYDDEMLADPPPPPTFFFFSSFFLLLPRPRHLDNGIGNDGARSLAAALKQNTTLTMLDLVGESEARAERGIRFPGAHIMRTRGGGEENPG